MLNLSEKQPLGDEIQRNIQIKIQKLLELQKEAEYYQQVLESTTLLLSEILKTKKILEEMIQGERRTIESMINLGVGIYSPGTINFGEKVLVDVGSSVGVWMPLPDALERLKKQEQQLKDAANKTKANLTEIMNMISKLQLEIEKMRAYANKKQG